MYYRGRTVAESAEALRIPPGTVKSRSTTHYANCGAVLSRNEDPNEGRCPDEAPSITTGRCSAPTRSGPRPARCPGGERTTWPGLSGLPPGGRRALRPADLHGRRAAGGLHRRPRRRAGPAGCAAQCAPRRAESATPCSPRNRPRRRLALVPRPCWCCRGRTRRDLIGRQTAPSPQVAARAAGQRQERADHRSADQRAAWPSNVSRSRLAGARGNGEHPGGRALPALRGCGKRRAGAHGSWSNRDGGQEREPHGRCGRWSTRRTCSPSRWSQPTAQVQSRWPSEAAIRGSVP